MLRYLLDTNIVIYVIKRRPLAALQLFNAHAVHMALSSITLAELLHGAEKSNVASAVPGGGGRFLQSAGGAALGPQGGAALRQHLRCAGKTGASHWGERLAHCRPRPQ